MKPDRTVLQAAPQEPAGAILDVRDLNVSVKTPDGRFTILGGVSLRLDPGEALGVVGESGCGKSTLARAIMGILPTPPIRVDRGVIAFDGRDLLRLGRSELNRLRGRELTMIFQDPNSSLNPVFTVGDQLRSVAHLQAASAPWFGASRQRTARATDRAAEMLARVRMPDPRRVMESYPFQLSGGMRQRVLIAMALLNEPKLVVADEPGTALDVTIQDQILELFEALLIDRGLSVLYITHNLGIARRVARRLVVMYAGQIAEIAPTRKLFSAPLHPYTQGLLNCVPKLAGGRAKGIDGRIPDLAEMPTGCRFHPRCPWRMEICVQQAPPLIDLGGGQQVACHLYQPGASAEPAGG